MATDTRGLAARDVASAQTIRRNEKDESYLREEATQLFIRVTHALAAFWAVALLTLFDDGRLISWLVPAGLCFVAALAQFLARQRPRWAGISLPSGLLLVLSAYLWLRPDAAASFMAIPLIVIANVTAPRRAWVVLAIAACAGLGIISWLVSGSVTPLYRMAIFSSALTALTAWLATRNLHLALSWSTYHREQARRGMEDLRARRAELARLAHMLRNNEERLHYMNIHLERAKLSAEEAYRMKQHFVANISHELRTPLSLIIGFSEMMVNAPESYGSAALPSAYRGDVMAIYRSARHLSELIDDVLDLAQIEADRLPLVKETVDLREVVHESAEMVRDLVRTRGIQFEATAPEEPVAVRIDRTRIRQVLLNLLSNAARHTFHGSIRTRIDVEASEAIITVEDTGRGIAPEQLSRAFEAFSQMQERPGEGTGLGLALSKRFVELHGGRMWIESELGRGTRVTFALPVLQEGQEVALSRLVAGWPKRGQPDAAPVLVLSDDTRALPLLSRHIEGYEFAMASDPASAAEIVRNRPPIAVIVDAACAERWNATLVIPGLPPDVPTIVCPLPNVHHAGRLLGAVDYLPKPVTREDLARAFERLPRPPATVLIVDDNLRVVRLIARMVRTYNPGIRTLQASSGRDALQIIRSKRPDVALLDLIMPVMSGYELLQEMERDETLPETPVIIISVRATEEETAPVGKELRVSRQAGLSLTTVVRALRAVLPAVVPGAAAAPTNGVNTREAPPGSQA